MPKTTVNKEGELKLWKNEIRFAEELDISPPASNAVALKQFDQGDFSCLIASTPNA